MAQGRFLTFEGLDGSGKTTQIQRLAEWLASRGHQVVVTRQPGGTALGERIRELLVHSHGGKSTGGAELHIELHIDPRAELALMFADRAQSIAEIIRPAVAAGKVVLCDRYTDSSEAYQGGGRELGSETVLALHRAVCGNLQPEMTVMLLPPLAASLSRARQRNHATVAQQGTDEGRFESLDDSFYQRVYDTYKAIAAREPGRVALIEDDAGIEAIHEHICAAVQARLGL